MKIGFAILSYNNPLQLLRLAKTLDVMFDAPPIACHHNFNQSSLDRSLFPPCVEFVQPHLHTKWGHISTPLAALRSFRHLADHHLPDWYFLLSGSDYPVRSAADILRDLSVAKWDAYLDSEEIRIDRQQPNGTTGRGFPLSVANDRYRLYHGWVPCPSLGRLLAGALPLRRKHFKISNNQVNMMLRLGVKRPERMYRGDFWFQANHKAVSVLLDPRLKPLWRYYRNTEIPEESAFHTALCNASNISICNDNKRFSNWDNGGAHPKWLELADIPSVVASGAHFARKFLPDGVVQDFVDETVLKLA